MKILWNDNFKQIFLTTPKKDFSSKFRDKFFAAKSQIKVTRRSLEKEECFMIYVTETKKNKINFSFFFVQKEMRKVPVKDES